MAGKYEAEKIIEILGQKFGKPKPALNYSTPFQLLIAVILSAQCTDKRVNIVTEELFKYCKIPADFVEIPIEKLEELIKSTGFYKNKAKNIKNCSGKIIEEYGGEVPGTMEELLELPGVGRKTANVMLGHIFGTPGIVVDTHVKRNTKRIGFTENVDPVKIEYDLMKIVPQKDWTLFSDLIILHGRDKCKAGKPACGECSIREYCDMGRGIKK